jgi:hypothetical protein
MEAVDDRNVLILLVACQVIESRTGIEIPEIWNELREFERKPYAQRLVGRGIHKLRPTDAAAARQVLFDIIDRATAQIAVKAEAHRVRAEINDSLATDRLLFDDSPEGERLRRFDLACGRGMARSLESLVKLRRASELVGCPSSDLQDRLSFAGDTLESSAPSNATNEPTDAGENATNEPTDAYPRERKVLKRSTGRIKIKSRIKNKDRRPTVTCENVTNEPNVDREIVTNEPTVDREIVTNESTGQCENATNEPTGVQENATNEPTVDGENMTNEPTAGYGNPPNEPTASPENATNEPSFAAIGNDDLRARRPTITTDRYHHENRYDNNSRFDRTRRQQPLQREFNAGPDYD